MFHRKFAFAWWQNSSCPRETYLTVPTLKVTSTEMVTLIWWKLVFSLWLFSLRFPTGLAPLSLTLVQENKWDLSFSPGSTSFSPIFGLQFRLKTLPLQKLNQFNNWHFIQHIETNKNAETNNSSFILPREEDL